MPIQLTDALTLDDVEGSSEEEIIDFFKSIQGKQWLKQTENSGYLQQEKYSKTFKVMQELEIIKLSQGILFHEEIEALEKEYNKYFKNRTPAPLRLGLKGANSWLQNLNINRGGIILSKDPTTQKFMILEAVKVQGRQEITTKKLGEGGFSKVKLYRNISDHSLVPIKIAKKQLNTAEQQEMQHEVELCQTIGLSAYGGVIEKIGGQSNKIAIMVNFIEGGVALHQAMTQQKQSQQQAMTTQQKQSQQQWNETDLLLMASTILRELKRLHDQGITHCDIKPANFILDKNNHCHVIDLGLALRSSETCNRLRGTDGYIAPEVINTARNATNKGEKAPVFPYQAPVDVYAAGRIFQDLFNITKPYMYTMAGKDYEVGTYNFSGVKNLSQEDKSNIQDLVQGMLKQNPGERTSLDEAIKTIDNLLLSYAEKHNDQQKIAYVKSEREIAEREIAEREIAERERAERAERERAERERAEKVQKESKELRLAMRQTMAKIGKDHEKYPQLKKIYDDATLKNDIKSQFCRFTEVCLTQRSEWHWGNTTKTGEILKEILNSNGFSLGRGLARSFCDYSSKKQKNISYRELRGIVYQYEGIIKPQDKDMDKRLLDNSFFDVKNDPKTIIHFEGQHRFPWQGANACTSIAMCMAAAIGQMSDQAFYELLNKSSMQIEIEKKHSPSSYTILNPMSNFLSATMEHGLTLNKHVSSNFWDVAMSKKSMKEVNQGIEKLKQSAKEHMIKTACKDSGSEKLETSKIKELEALAIKNLEKSTPELALVGGLKQQSEGCIIPNVNTFRLSNFLQEKLEQENANDLMFIATAKGHTTLFFTKTMKDTQGGQSRTQYFSVDSATSSFGGEMRIFDDEKKFIDYMENKWKSSENQVDITTLIHKNKPDLVPAEQPKLKI